MQRLELAANRAMTTTRREADIGKARRPLQHANRHAKQMVLWCYLTFLRSLQGLPTLL